MITLLAPMAGWVSPLGEVPDPVFSGRLMGDGVAIDPVAPRVVAPCEGIIATLAAHAFTIRHDSGLEVLIHVGLETVALKGKGFAAEVAEGQRVKAGDTVLTADLDFLARHAKSLITPVIIAQPEAARIMSRRENCEIAAGEILMEIALAEATQETLIAPAVTATAIVGGAHGLHARPSALIAAAAKRVAGPVTLTCRGRSADAKSATAIMALGAAEHDEIAIAAPSRASADAIAAVIAAAGGQDHRVAPLPMRTTLPANTATLIHAVPAAPGRAVGPAVQLRAAEIAVPETGRGIAAETTDSRQALAALQARLQIEAASGDRTRREILSAHMGLLDDPGLIASAERKIAEGKSAAFAWRTTLRAAADDLRAMGDARLRERAGDFLDLERQLVALLIGETSAPAPDLPPGAILIADEILPSDLKPGIAGFVSAGGGPTSHAAILAAGMAIPALVAAGPSVLAIAHGTELLLDADTGTLDLAPAAAARDETRKASAAASARLRRDEAEAATDAVTADGARIEVFANLGKGAAEAVAAVHLGAEGCGVLRTEFLFMDRQTPPDEDEQCGAYQAIADALSGRPFIIRTFDIGADKPVPYLSFAAEDNPQLGLRGVRTASIWPDLLKTQIRAAARVEGRVKLMLPMINTAEEVRAVRALMREIGCENVPLGAMIETPSAGLLADRIAAEADFLSIGTNDLTQYVLAIDRGHRVLSAKLDALEPAVLRLIARTAECAKAAGKTAAVCGGIAADSLAAPILIGLGITELSVPAPVIPRLKSVIRALDISACRKAARAALDLESAAAVRALAKANFGEELRR